MAYDYERNVKTRSSADQIDQGLKAYMNKVYSFMAVGLALTGVIAHLTSTMAFDFRTNTMTAFGNAIYGSPLAFVIMLAPLGFIIALNMGIAKMKESTVQVLFWAFAAVMGLSLSSIFIQYTGESVARVFFISAAAFGALSLYGYTTKKDLTNLVYMRLGFSKQISTNLIDEFFSLIISNLLDVKKIKISNFGTFSIKSKKSRVGRNPKTKEEKIISSRNVILFKPSKEFKNYINSQGNE